MKLSFFLNLFFKREIKSLSISTEEQEFALDTIKEVKFPDPGPISKKSSFFFTFIKSTKSPSNTSSLIKFWPNLFFGEISFITLTE